MKKWMIPTVIMMFGAIFVAGSTQVKASEQDEPKATGMRAEYDKITSGKMKRYDGLMSEITELRDRIEELLAKEQKLSDEKKKAKSSLAGSTQAAEIADENVKKAMEDASGEDERMRRFADAVAKESVARRKKIEKLKADLKEANARMKELQDSKNKTEAENATRDAEYKDAMNQGNAAEGEKTAPQKNASGTEPESTRLKTRISELETKVQEGERLRQQLAEEILASAEKIRTVEEEISALEGEDALKTKELRTKIENFDKTGSENKRKDQALEGLRKIAGEANSKMLKEKTALQKVDEDLEKASGEKIQAEKDLVEKTGDLKVRISALVVQNERDQDLLPEKAEASEKNMKKRLKRAEREVVELQRKTEKALMVNKEFKEKFDKEMMKKHFNLAVVYEMNGLYKDSEKEYLECLKIDPDDADVHYNLAILYDDRLNENKKAQKHYYKYLSFRPIGESGERVRDWILRTELERRFGSTVR